MSLPNVCIVDGVMTTRLSVSSDPVHVVSFKTSPETFWLCGKAVSIALGYRNHSQAIRYNCAVEYKSTLGDLYQKNGHPIHGDPDVKLNMNQSKAIYIYLIGLHQLIVQSRKSISIDFALSCGINLLNSKIPCKEAETMNAIKKSFRGEVMVEQARFDNSEQKYFVDLLVPKHRLVIECDENGHSTYDCERETSREEYLTSNAFTIIRFNPDSTFFNIFDVINRIYTLLMRTTKSAQLLE